MKLARPLALVAFVLSLALALAPSASADESWRPAGALTGHFLVADGDTGGAALLDVWVAADWARVGGFVGAGAIPSGRDAYNRVMMPFGISFAADYVANDYLSLQGRVRAGLWGGSTQSEKLTIGAFVGAGVYLGFRIGNGAVIQVGADFWGLIGSDAWRTPTGPDDGISASTWVLAPGLGFSWTPEES